MVEGQLSHYARMSGHKRNARERPYDPAVQNQAAYQQREQYPAMRHSNYPYGVPPLDGKSNRDPTYYQMHEIPKNMSNSNGMHQNLNYVSANLNRESGASYNQFYSNSHQKGPVSHSLNGSYQSPSMYTKMKQYQGNHEYEDGSHSLKSHDPLTIRGSMQN